MSEHELTVACESLGLTPGQRLELAADEERALAWITWLRSQTAARNPTALLIAKFRTGAWPPDPNAWRGGEEGGPNYPRLLKACSSLVEHTAHEYADADLLDEFARLGRTAGRGASLTDQDRERLLYRAGLIRAVHERGTADRVAHDEEITVALWARMVADRTVTRAWAELAARERFADDPALRDRVIAGLPTGRNRTSGEELIEL